jgi:peptidoglycan-N-acetylglucosamine deacetylase
MITNIMSVDLEDYYIRSPFETWDNFESRIIEPTNFLLDIFEKNKVEATFFTLGYIAERHPELIEKIVSKGHEISSHSYSHREVKNMTKKEFEEDLVRSINIIKKVAGEEPLGFRAPRFSITKETFWAFDVMRKYLKYDSSIFPVSHVQYGIPSAPKMVYKVSSDNPLIEDEESNFIELPMATLQIFGVGNIPIAGGFWLRFFPVSLINWGIKKLNDKKINATFYIHPHDLDVKKPKIQGYPWHLYWNLSESRKKVESVIRNFKFSSVRSSILNK